MWYLCQIGAILSSRRQIRQVCPRAHLRVFSNAEFCAESDSGEIFDIRGCTVGQNLKKPKISLFFSKLITDSTPKSLIDLLQTPCACCHIVWEELTSILRPYLNYYGNEKLRRCQKNARFYLCFFHVQKRYVIGAISGQKWIEKLPGTFSSEQNIAGNLPKAFRTTMEGQNLGRIVQKLTKNEISSRS